MSQLKGPGVAARPSVAKKMERKSYRNGRIAPTANRRSIFQFSGLGELAARMIKNRHAAELALIAGMIVDPRRAVPIILAAGITSDSFDAGDIRTIATCTIAIAEQPSDFTREEFFNLIADTLRARGFWNDAAPVAPPFANVWNVPNLRKLFGLEYFCRASLQKNARRVLELEQIQRKAAGLLFRASDLAMEGACR